MHIYPYSMKSASAKALAEALGIKRAKAEGKPLKTDVLINWGASTIEREINGVILNKPEAVKKAVNKLETFKALKSIVPIPDFTESLEEANKWLAEGATVVARTKLAAHSGEGIIIIDTDSGEKLPKAKLYTRYVPKTSEFRVHTNKDGAFFVQQKKRNKEVADDKVNWMVRNYANGFIFANKDLDIPNVVRLTEITVNAIRALDLDFGAVDVIYNQKRGEYYVLEVNTACGMEGTTLDKYVEMFKEIA